MERTRLSSKGQVIIPKWIRDRHEWQPGDELVVLYTEQGVTLKLSRPFPETTLDDVVGCLSYSGPTVSIEEMDEVISAAIQEKFGDHR